CFVLETLMMVPGVMSHDLIPCINPSYARNIRTRGIATKVIFDCTVPFDQKDRFQRAQFKKLDPKKWLPDFDF
ncbi:MAG: hypothetical protein LUF68_00800, partial [Clostridiales bacterium]|nr:hypothetical protein [Clostridiales bacterium]